MSIPTPTDADREEDRTFSGLCARCVHLQVLRNAHSCFVRCGLSDVDPRFARYPRLPQVFCRGFEAHNGKA